MKIYKLLSVLIIITALVPVFLFNSCARVDLNNSNNTSSNHAVARLYIALASDVDKEGIEINTVENILLKHFDGATLQ